jgi:hypothetical protein
MPTALISIASMNPRLDAAAIATDLGWQFIGCELLQRGPPFNAATNRRGVEVLPCLVASMRPRRSPQIRSRGLTPRTASISGGGMTAKSMVQWGRGSTPRGPDASYTFALSTVHCSNEAVGSAPRITWQYGACVAWIAPASMRPRLTPRGTQTRYEPSSISSPSFSEAAAQHHGGLNVAMAQSLGLHRLQ